MRADSPPVIAIVGEAHQVSAEAARSLSPFSVALVGLSGALPGGPACDILVVGLAGASLAALEWALARWSALGRPELVFVCADVATDPYACGLAAAGVRYVISENIALGWLREHAPALAEFARARRALQAATQRLPAAPTAGCPLGDVEAPGLFQAEQSFRATYIQALLARSRSRRDAAQKARIAYRTFCHILEKLGISSRKVDRQRLAITDDPLLSLPMNGNTGQHRAGENRAEPRERRIKS
jgi:hypothetical protein